LVGLGLSDLPSVKRIKKKKKEKRKKKKEKRKKKKEKKILHAPQKTTPVRY
jgi:hypothetical protein